MSLNPKKEAYNLFQVKKELEEIEEESNACASFLRSKEQKLSEEREERIVNYRKEASDAYDSTQLVRERLDDELKKNKISREKEVMQIQFEEKQRKNDMWEDMEKWQSFDIRNSELRQQYLDRDSARDKDDLHFKTNEFRKALECKKSYDNNLFDNKMKYLTKSKKDFLEVLDGKTRLARTLGDVETKKLMAAEAQKTADEVRLASNESCERTVNKALGYGIPFRTRRNNNNYEIDYYL
jgi:hypothetical protein